MFTEVNKVVIPNDWNSIHITNKVRVSTPLFGPVVKKVFMIKTHGSELQKQQAHTLQDHVATMVTILHAQQL